MLPCVGTVSSLGSVLVFVAAGAADVFGAAAAVGALEAAVAAIGAAASSDSACRELDLVSAKLKCTVCECSLPTVDTKPRRAIEVKQSEKKNRSSRTISEKIAR